MEPKGTAYVLSEGGLLASLRKYEGLEARETFIIGNTMDTDIFGGVQVGYTTILTLSDVSHLESLVDYAFKPDLIVNSVADIKLDEVLSLK